jgi:hypothetical protein
MTADHTTELLAGLLDLIDQRRPPHADGPCTALCVPSCSGSTAVRPRRDVSTVQPAGDRRHTIRS